MLSKVQCETKGGPALFRRRHAVKLGATAVALGITLDMVKTHQGLANTMIQNRGELYAFRAPDKPAVVFAVASPTANRVEFGSERPMLRIHVGSRCWCGMTDDVLPTSRSEDEVFIGHAVKPSGTSWETYYLTVVSTPVTSFSPGVLPVWAEILGRGNSRLRVGNPIFTALLAQEPALARVFHRAYPEDDHALFAASLKNRRSNPGPVDSTLPPKISGERLAALLLPDVLLLDPARPIGFTFAGQNGRRLSDPVSEVVSTVLSGTVATGMRNEDLFRVSPMFPYFLDAYV